MKPQWSIRPGDIDALFCRPDWFNAVQRFAAIYFMSSAKFTDWPQED